MQILPNEKNILLQGSGCVWSCVHLHELQQDVTINSPGWRFFKQLISSSKQQTQNCAMDTAICNMMNIQLLVTSSSSAESEVN